MAENPDAASLKFADLLSQRKWESYEQFVSEAPGFYQQELEEDIKREEGLREKIRKDLLLHKFEVKSYRDQLGEAEKLLFSGRVIAIDGTVSKFKTLSGLRCQIGVVAVNYFNDMVRKAYFISEASLRNEESEVLEIIKNREQRNRLLSDMVVRALMLYREREVAMRSEYLESFRMLHGPLLPFELMTGLGRLRALEATLGILQSVAADPKCFSIISASTHDDYLTLGMALEPGEYMRDPNFSLGDEIAENKDFMVAEKWRESEFERVKGFLRTFADKIHIGIIRVSGHPYVFYAHKDTFDLAVAIIARDSLLQKEKGFPLLVDYADTLCSEFFPPGDFTGQLLYKLAQEGHFLSEISERALRQK